MDELHPRAGPRGGDNAGTVWRCWRFPHIVQTEDSSMSKDGIKGATQKGVGAAKEAAGKAVGDEKLRAEGVADKAAGSAKEAVGKAKDAVHKATR
jgi:uncharacterized protein YjbJ (UPF0337 family)